MPNARRRGQRGFALITAILFLVLLTLIAISAFKTSGLEAKMGANNALHAQAFESSEIVRHSVESLVDANVFARGWPTTIGGTVAPAQFGTTTLLTNKINCSSASPSSYSTYGFSICTDSGAPRNWYDSNSECTSSGTCAFTPGQLDTDALYAQSVSTTPNDGSADKVNGLVNVYKLNTSLATGAGVQQAAGYMGLGRAAAAGGGLIYFYINGHGMDYRSRQAPVDTSALFREVIKN